MTGKTAQYLKTRVPKPVFPSIKAIDRYKRTLLGLPVDKMRKDIPWGFIVDPNNAKRLLPNIESLRLLIKAKEYLLTCSLKTVADWLTEVTKEKISSEGLRIILLERCPFPEIMLDEHERERHFTSPSTLPFTKEEQKESKSEQAGFSDEENRIIPEEG